MIDETRETVWELRDGDAAAAQALAGSLQIDPLVATLLVNRGVEERDAALRFLRPRLSEMPDPFLMKGMEEAVTRILSAMEREESVCVWGDYDVDGVTSASQLIAFFEVIGYPARFFVPDRFRDGYGLHPERIRELAQSGVDLLITVDCGISNVEEVEIAREEGMEVIMEGMYMATKVRVMDMRVKVMAMVKMVMVMMTDMDIMIMDMEEMIIKTMKINTNMLSKVIRDTSTRNIMMNIWTMDMKTTMLMMNMTEVMSLIPSRRKLKKKS